MPLPIPSISNPELPIGTHGIFTPNGTGFSEIGHIFVKLSPDRLFWYDWASAGSPPNVFYVLQDHSNGKPSKALWNKYAHANLGKLATAESPSGRWSSGWKVWTISYGTCSTGGETNGHPYSAGATIVGYFAVKNSDASMEWWIKEGCVDVDDNDPLEGLVKFNTPSQHSGHTDHPCLHFARLDPCSGIPAERFFVCEHSPLT